MKVDNRAAVLHWHHVHQLSTLICADSGTLRGGGWMNRVKKGTSDPQLGEKGAFVWEAFV